MTVHSTHYREIAENIFGAGTPQGSNWIRRAVEKTGVDVSSVHGSWVRKLYVALGGDVSTAAGGCWMRSVAYLLGAEDRPGSWDEKVAAEIMENGGITHPTLDTTDITMDSDKFTLDNQ